MADYPDRGQLVVCECTKILKYGAFFKLVEHGDLEGFMHVSQVSSGWVKNINSLLRVGATYVAKVNNTDIAKQQIDLSLRNVSEGMRAARMLQWRHDKRAKALLAVVAKRLKVEEKEVWEKVGNPLIANYGNLYNGFEAMSLSGEPVLKLPKEWNDVLLEIAKKSIEVPLRTVKGIITITCGGADGLEAIKLVLGAAEKSDDTIEMSSVSAPKYGVKIIAPDFKTAEAVLSKALGAAEVEAKKHKACVFSFAKSK